MAKQLQEHGWLPSVIMCSNSLRTQQTLDSMKDAVDALYNAEAHFRGSLYTIAALDGQTRRHLQVDGTCTDCWCRCSALFASQQAAFDVPCCLVAAKIVVQGITAVSEWPCLCHSLSNTGQQWPVLPSKPPSIVCLPRCLSSCSVCRHTLSSTAPGTCHDVPGPGAATAWV